MRIIKKIVLWLVVIVGLSALVIAILRWINGAETARLEEVKGGEAKYARSVRLRQRIESR